MFWAPSGALFFAAGRAGLVTAARVIAWLHLALFALLLVGIIAFGFVVGTRG